MTTFHLQVERPGHLCSRVGRRLSRRNERRFNRQLLRFSARSLQEIRSKSARLWQKTKQTVARLIQMCTKNAVI